MKSKTPNVAKPLPIEQSFTSLEDVFHQALALELRLAQQARAKEAAQAGQNRSRTEQPASPVHAFVAGPRRPSLP